MRRGLSPHWLAELSYRYGTVSPGVQNPAQYAGWTTSSFFDLCTELHNPMLNVQNLFPARESDQLVHGLRPRPDRVAHHGRRVVRPAGYLGSDRLGLAAPAGAGAHRGGGAGIRTRARAGDPGDVLVQLDVAPSRVTAVGCGQDHLIATNETPEGQARNRRVQSYRIDNQKTYSQSPGGRLLYSVSVARFRNP